MTTSTTRRENTGFKGSKKQTARRVSPHQSAVTKVKLHLPKRFTNDVRVEARALGLTTDEYLRLLLALSKSLRQGMLKKQNFDAKALLQLVESPIFAGLIQYVADSAGSLTKSDDTKSEDKTTNTPDPHTAPGQPVPSYGGEWPRQPYAPSTAQPGVERQVSPRERLAHSPQPSARPTPPDTRRPAPFALRTIPVPAYLP